MAANGLGVQNAMLPNHTAIDDRSLLLLQLLPVDEDRGRAGDRAGPP